MLKYTFFHQSTCRLFEKHVTAVGITHAIESENECFTISPPEYASDKAALVTTLHRNTTFRASTPQSAGTIFLADTKLTV